VTRVARFGSLALLALAPVGLGLGCTEPTSTSINQTPPSVLEPAAPDEAKPEAAKDEGKGPEASAPAEDAKEAAAADVPKAQAAAAAAVTPVDLAAASPAAPAAGEAVTLVPLKYEALRAKLAANSKPKLTIMDAWATWCGPCKENFPHLVEMHEKYGDQGLAVVSLSLDDPEDPKAIGEATEFLRSKKAAFTNILLNETQEDAFNKLDISTIPAVFLFDPDGKELKRYTLDDPNAQFTYEQVEREVAGFLKGEPLPGAKAESEASK
jgi:thiol-disulfide isomerase/thioredoxin